jgi:hypothetical protein
VSADQGRRDAFGHLQAAAHELIEAARAALDAADEVVSDRIRLMTMLLGRAPGRSEAERQPPKVEKIEIEKPPRPPGPEPG